MTKYRDNGIYTEDSRGFLKIQRINSRLQLHMHCDDDEEYATFGRAHIVDITIPYPKRERYVKPLSGYEAAMLDLGCDAVAKHRIGLDLPNPDPFPTFQPIPLIKPEPVVPKIDLTPKPLVPELNIREMMRESRRSTTDSPARLNDFNPAIKLLPIVSEPEPFVPYTPKPFVPMAMSAPPDPYPIPDPTPVFEYCNSISCGYSPVEPPRRDWAIQHKIIDRMNEATRLPMPYEPYHDLNAECRDMAARSRGPAPASYYWPGR